MRIIPNNDPSDDNGDNDRDRRCRRNPGRGEPSLRDLVGDTPDHEFGDILADEIGSILAAAEPDNNPDTAPASMTFPSPSRPVKPVLRLVNTDSQDVEDQAPEAAGRPADSVRPRLLRAGLAGSPFVVVAAVAAGWGAPATVAAPVGVYALGWLAYLWWNAALRPPIPQVLAALAAAIGRGLAALAAGVAATVRAGFVRLDRARTRHENQRTATA